jgi:hypothetical protein
MRLVVCAAVLVVGCAPESPASLPEGGGEGGAVAARQPAPLFGGTVAVASDGTTVAVSNPDGDLLWLVNVDRASTRAVLLPPGSQPGRAVDDGAGHFAVTLRKTGQVVRVAMSTGAVSTPISVCNEPRGITRTDTGLLVACATGEVVRLQGSEATVLRVLEREARDVFEARGRLYVSAFREAALVDVATSGQVVPPPVRAFPASTTPVVFVPRVAWRTFARPDGEVVMVHQHERQGEPTLVTPGGVIVPATSGYGQPPRPPPPEMMAPPPMTPPTPPQCEQSVMRTAVTRFLPSGGLESFEVPGVLPVDAALSPDGTTLAIAHASSHQVTRVSLAAPPVADPTCGPTNSPAALLDQRPLLEHPVGVAYLPSGELLVHFRSPQVLVMRGPSGNEVARIALPGPTADSRGHRLFHLSTGSIACASCHPEGHDDGHTWTVNRIAHRTQALSGGLLAHAPFHWRGEHADLSDVMQDTFVSRMGGVMPDADAVASLGRFLDGLPAPQPLSRPAGSSEGRRVFVMAGCAACHAGRTLSSSASVDIGKAGPTQVPSLLGLSRRGPWMSDGCAQTLRQRFDAACGGATHGDTAALSPSQLDALVAYLERL